MKSVTLITGVSSGIGLAFAHLFAANYHDLFLVARDKKVLNAIKKELEEKYKIDVRILSVDLAESTSADVIVRELKKEKLDVDVLVNNAGFATYGKFTESNEAELTNMMHVNMVTLTRLTRSIAAQMVKRKKGKILNVASTAAFQPGPLMAVYYATKSFVLFFSEALANELKDEGITVTCLCPGPTQTRFQSRAKMEQSKIIRKGRMMSAEEVAKVGYEGMLSGKRIVIPGLRNRVGALFARLAPLDLSTDVVRRIQEKE